MDDLFLKTPEFSYGAGGVDEKGELLNEGTVRWSLVIPVVYLRGWGCSSRQYSCVLWCSADVYFCVGSAHRILCYGCPFFKDP